MVDSLGNLVHLTSLNLSSTWHGGVGCVACVYACCAVSEYVRAAVAVWRCVTDVDVVGVWAWAPGNGLGVGGASALAGPLGKLVHLTSLNLSSAWHEGVWCVVCVYMPCRIRVCVGGCGGVKLCG